MVWDAEKACVEVEDYYAAISYLAQTSLREAVGRDVYKRQRLDVCDGSHLAAEGGIGCGLVAHSVGAVSYTHLPLMVERVATMPDPVITQPNYAIEPCEAALRAADAVALQNLGEI